MGKRKRVARRAVSHVLQHSARLIEYGCFGVRSVLDEHHAPVTAREGPLQKCLTDKEVDLLSQRIDRANQMAKDIRKIAIHLRQASS